MRYSVSWVNREHEVQEQAVDNSQLAWELKYRAREAGMYNATIWRKMDCGNCGEELTITGDTECGCGQLYNGAGQKLVPRNLWEEPWEE